MSAVTGSDRARRAAIRLLRWYPRPWRMRYEREMRALLDDIPGGWRQVGNIAGTAVREWLSPRALGWPARSAAGRIRMVRLLTFMACAFTLDAVARLVAARLIAADFTISDSVQTTIAWFLVGPLLRFISSSALQGKRVQRSRWAAAMSRHHWLNYLSDWEVAAWLLLLFPWMVVRQGWPSDSPYTGLMRELQPYEHIWLIWLWTYALVGRSSKTARLWKIELRTLPRLGPDKWVTR